MISTRIWFSILFVVFALLQDPMMGAMPGGGGGGKFAAQAAPQDNMGRIRRLAEMPQGAWDNIYLKAKREGHSDLVLGRAKREVDGNVPQGAWDNIYPKAKREGHSDIVLGRTKREADRNGPAPTEYHGDLILGREKREADRNGPTYSDPNNSLRFKRRYDYNYNPYYPSYPNYPYNPYYPPIAFGRTKREPQGNYPTNPANRPYPYPYPNYPGQIEVGRR